MNEYLLGVTIGSAGWAILGCVIDDESLIWMGVYGVVVGLIGVVLA